MSPITLHSVSPQAGVHGGQIKVMCHGLDPQTLAGCRLVFGSEAVRPLLVTQTLLLGAVPEAADARSLQIVQEGESSNAVPFLVATLLADNLHPVMNPVVDRQGAVYTTISGTKGQHVPVSLFKMPPLGDIEPFVSGIANPTGLAFGPDGGLYISSRHMGLVYRVEARGTVATFAEHLGIPTGLAFDAQGQLYVGDRRGTIYQVSEGGGSRLFARLEPSVTAYHLAFGGDGQLYVSYPTLSGYDQIYRITPDGVVQPFVSGLGRAQGLAFDTTGNLYAVAHFQGEGGVIKITPTGDVQQVLAGINLVGLCFTPQGDLMLVDNSALYKLEIGVLGRLL